MIRGSKEKKRGGGSEMKGQGSSGTVAGQKTGKYKEWGKQRRTPLGENCQGFRLTMHVNKLRGLSEWGNDEPEKAIFSRGDF